MSSDRSSIRRMAVEEQRPDDRLPVERVNPDKDGDDTVHGTIPKPKDK